MARRMSDDALYKNREWLRGRYEVNKLSSCEIAKLCGVRSKAILYYLHKFNLMQPALGEKVLITSQVEQLIIGTVLGDASLTMQSKNPRLSVGHREQDIEYLRWKYDILKVAGLIKGPIYHGQMAQFGTVSSPHLWKYRNLFYKEGHRVLSKQALNMLTPFSLAIWYMDNGTFFKRSRHSATLRISTERFSEKENCLAAAILEKKFEFHFRVHRHKRQWVLQMSDGNNVFNFLNIVKPYIHPVMAYKCPDFVPITKAILSEERSERAKQLWRDPEVRSRILLGQERARAAR